MAAVIDAGNSADLGHEGTSNGDVGDGVLADTPLSSGAPNGSATALGAASLRVTEPQASRPLREIAATDAFRALKSNPHAEWPRVDDPGNRFATFADPAFTPRLTLEPGQRIFTIGSCFARNIEDALVARGFDVPTRAFMLDSGGQSSILNNYVPAAVAPQIRWAFGLDRFDPTRHCAELRKGGFIDLQLALPPRPVPLDAVIARREAVNAVYRKLADSRVVLLTLGLIEAWFDRLSGLYINMTPPKSFALAHPDRFVLQVLEYNQVLAQLDELVDLFDRVCPADYRMIVTVSPVPLTATFTMQDVAVANIYSKSVLRTAVETLTCRRGHIEYFPSYESVVLSDRALAFGEDQVHVAPEIVRFNVDKMVRRYVAGAAAAPEQIIEQAAAERRAGNAGAGLALLRDAVAGAPDDGALLVALADAHMRRGNRLTAERLLIDHVGRQDDVKAHMMLAEHFIACGRWEEAARHGEAVARSGTMRLRASLARAKAYVQLGRPEEALAVLQPLRYAATHAPKVHAMKARILERLGRFDEAEMSYVLCTNESNNSNDLIAFATFLEARGRRAEALTWLERARLAAPTSGAVLAARLRMLGGNVAAPHGLASRLRHRMRNGWLAARQRWADSRADHADG